MSIYDFVVKTNRGEDRPMSDYKNKVLLIVNTASKCGFTPQYKELQELYLKYQDRGLEILGFPCNQFAGQEPEDNAGIENFCRVNYGVTFQIFAKGDVKGENAQPLFKYLVEKQGFHGFDESHPIAKKLVDFLGKMFPDSLGGDSIKWNFTKFLVDRNGEVVARFEPTTNPSEIAGDIERLL